MSEIPKPTNLVYQKKDFKLMISKWKSRKIHGTKLKKERTRLNDNYTGRPKSTSFTTNHKQIQQVSDQN